MIKKTLLFCCFLLAGIASRAQSSTSKPFVLGVIEEIQSTQLNEKRILNIYLPEGYNKTDTIHYPVIYLLDGSADEDFIHVAGLVQFNSFDWIQRTPKSIVVGIANTDRKRDLTFPTAIEEDKKKYPTTGHSDKFTSFIQSEVMPSIEKNYKTNHDKTLIGESLGGLFAAEVLLKHPSLFNRYVIISPSLWWNNGTLLDQDSDLLKENFNQNTDIYIGVGKEGLTPTKLPRVMEVDANLLADKINKTKSPKVHCHFDYLPEEDHATVAHQALMNAFRILWKTNNR